MKTIIFCITNDIIYDRRILRCADSLSELYHVEVICRKIHEQNYSSPRMKVHKIKCQFNKGFLFYAEFNIKLFFHLLFKRFNILIAIDYDTLIPVVLTGKMKNAVIGFDAHEYFEESIEITSRPRIKRFWEWIGRWGVPRVDFAYTVSQSIANIYTSKYELPVDCIRNLPFYQNPNMDIDSKLKDLPKIILYQGVLNKGRQLEILIDASEYLNQDYEIWIIGEGDESQSLKELASSKKGACQISFYSWVVPDELHRYTEKAFLAYNLLDQKSKSYYYSLANKFFDYIQAGVPSINSSFPEYRFYFENYDCCYLFDADNGESLATFIKGINPEEYILKSNNCLKAAKELNWEIESKRLIELIKRADNQYLK